MQMNVEYKDTRRFPEGAIFSGDYNLPDGRVHLALEMQ